MTVLSKTIYQFNIIPSESINTFFKELGKKIILNHKRSKTAKAIYIKKSKLKVSPHLG